MSDSQSVTIERGLKYRSSANLVQSQSDAGAVVVHKDLTLTQHESGQMIDNSHDDLMSVSYHVVDDQLSTNSSQMNSVKGITDSSQKYKSSLCIKSM